MEVGIASSGKRKTTMAKLNRERKLIEKRHAKQIRKDARKQAAAEGPPPDAPTPESALGRVDALMSDPG
jgi:hypothetical protein